MIDDIDEINPPLLERQDLLILRAYLMTAQLSLMFMWQRYNAESEEDEKIPWNIEK